MYKAKVIIAICILIAGLFGYAIGKHSAHVAPTISGQINLPYNQMKVSGIDNTQQKQIEDLVATFYKYQQQKDVIKIFALFTPPSNKQEQDELDFLLGKGLARVSAKPQTHLFTTQGYIYNIGGYYIRDIKHHNGATTVLVDEMRIIYSGGEYVGYSANIANLTLEIKQSNNKLKIVKYYHAQAKDNSALEGFNAY